MARNLDLMLCIFPFEAELYNKSGLRTIFVGHPMIEDLASHRLDVARDENLVALFPGSREREIRKILPIMLGAARVLAAEHAHLRFEIAASSPQIASAINATIESARVRRDLFSVTTGEASSLMQRAWAGIVASGTATLEAAYFGLPFVLVYKVAWPTYVAARAVVKVKYLGMPNVLADREIVPEFIQQDAQPQKIARAVGELITNAERREKLTHEFDRVIASLGQGGASETAAKAVLSEIG